MLCSTRSLYKDSRVHRRPWNRENTPGQCLGGIRNHGPQQTRALLFYGGSGESAGA